MVGGTRGRPGRGTLRTLQALLRQRRRLLLATVAIALGVGYLAGALTLLDRVGAGLETLAATGVGAEDLVAEGEVAYESSLEKVRRLVPTSVADSVRTVPGVAAVTPRIEDVAVILGADGRPVIAPGLSEQPLGANWPAGAPEPPYDLVTGSPPTGSDDLVIDEGSAATGNLQIGDEVSVVGRNRVGTYRITGLVAAGEGGLPPGSSLALLSTAEARDLFDRPFDDNWLGITLDPGADQAEVAERIRSTLPAGVELVDAQTAAADRQDGLTRSFALVRTLLIGFAALALLVGMVTVANSLALLYAERRRTFASFRLVGARPRQLLLAALVEAALLAVVASLIGAPLGLLIGRGIEWVLAELGSPIPVAGSIVSWQALGWAVVIGVAATVTAAVLPARRVCRVAPIEAVDDATVATSPPVLVTLRTATIAAVLAAGAVFIALIQGRETMLAATAAVVAGVVVFLLGLTPMALATVVAGGVRAVPVPPAALRRIAARDVRRSRTRTAATTGALAVATAVIVTLAVCLSSFVASLEAEVDRTVRADLVVDSGTFTRGGLPGGLLADLKGLPGVEASTGWQLARGTAGVTPLRMTGLDADAALDVVGFEFVGPTPTRLDTDSILLSERAATDAGVTNGDRVPVLFTSGGTEFLEVAGVFRGAGALIGDGVIDRTVVLRQVPATPDLAALVRLDPDDTGARQAVVDLAARYGVTNVLEPAQFVDQRSQLLRGFQRVIQWMLLFTLLQALVGVVNTLLLSVGERRREFGLLRATGATRAQIHRMVLLEGVALAVVGATLGLIVGLALSRAAIVPLAPLGLDSFRVPVVAIGLVGVLAVVVGVLAAVLPARWASRVAPLQAVSDTGDLELRRRRRRRAGRDVPMASPVPVPSSAPVPAPVPTPVGAVLTPPPFGPVAMPPPFGPVAVPPPFVAPVDAPAASAAALAAPMFGAAAAAGSSAGPVVGAERPAPMETTDLSRTGAVAEEQTQVSVGGPLGVPMFGAERVAFERQVAPVEGLEDAPSGPADAPVPTFGAAGVSGGPEVVEEVVAPVGAPNPSAVPMFGAGAASSPVVPPPAPPAPVPAPVPVAAPAPVVPPPAPVAPVFVPPPASVPPAPVPAPVPVAAPAPVVPPPAPPAPVFVPPPAPVPVAVPAPVAPILPPPFAPPGPLGVPEPTPEVELPFAPAAAAPIPDAPDLPPVPEVPLVFGSPIVPSSPDVVGDVPPRRRRRVFDRRAASTTRRRRERSGVGAAEGFLRTDSGDTDSGVEVSSTVEAPSVVPGIVPGAVAGSGEVAAFGSSWAGGPGPSEPGSSVPPPFVPPPVVPPRFVPPPDEPAPTFPGGEPEPVGAAVPALDTLAGALAPGEQVRHVVVGRTSGVECAIARTDRRILVVAARPGRPFVQSLHPTRTVVTVLGPRSLPATVVVIDGTQRLEIVGVADRDQAVRLANG